MLGVTKWISRNLTCFVIAITLVTEIFISVSALECDMTQTRDKKLYLNCANIEIEKVPSQYSHDLEIMNISHTSIHCFKEDDFKPYPKLKVIQMRGLFIRANCLPDKLWTSLIKLETLDVTGLIGDFDSFPKTLPSSIKYFHINEYYKTEQLNLIRLNNLVELHMAQSNSKDFPIMNKTAPLVMINLLLSYAMDNYRYQNFAPFCLLKILQMDHHNSLTKPMHEEQCCGIFIWVKTNGIEGLDRNFRCSKVCRKEEFQMNAEALSEHYNCLVRHGRVINKMWYFMVTIFIGVLVLAILGYIAFLLYKRLFNRPAIDHFVAKGTSEEEEESYLTDESSIKEPQ